MTVSIIITAYNQPNTLMWTIQSALRQTYEDTEIIIVDGGSTNTLAIHFATVLAAKRFSIPKGPEDVFYNDRPEALGKVTAIHTENNGISDARNVGAEWSKGEALVFLDDDNWIEPTFVEKTLSLMTPGIGVVSTDVHVFSENADTLCVTKVVPLEDLAKGNSIPSTSLIRREAFEQSGGFKNDVYEDWELWINILKRDWKMAVVNEPLFHYRNRPGSLINKLNKRHDELVENMRRLHPDVY